MEAAKTPWPHYSRDIPRFAEQGKLCLLLSRTALAPRLNPNGYFPPPSPGGPQPAEFTFAQPAGATAETARCNPLKLFPCSDDHAGEGERICAIPVSCLPYSCAFGRPQAMPINKQEALPDHMEFSQLPEERLSRPKVSNPHPAASLFQPGRSNPPRNSARRRETFLYRRETSSPLRANTSPQPDSGSSLDRSPAAVS